MRRFLVAMCALALLTGIGPLAGASPRAASSPLVHTGGRDSSSGIYLLKGKKSVLVQGANSSAHECGAALFGVGTRQQLVFESNRRNEPLGDLYDPNNYEIYRLEMGSGRLHRLTKDPGNDLFPAWSPDGRKIAFTREYPQHTDVPTGSGASTASAIWVMNPDGSGAKQLTPTDLRLAHNNPAWSPDGKKIAFSLTTLVGDEPSAIYMMNADGSHPRMLTANGERPAWSPDGKRIVFDSSPFSASFPPTASPLEHVLSVMRADGSHRHQLKHRNGAAEMMPSWAPDGRHIAYVYDADGWLGTVTAVLPTGDGQDVNESGPAPSQVWELELDRADRVVSRRQLSSGQNDLFPHYAPAA